MLRDLTSDIEWAKVNSIDSIDLVDAELSATRNMSADLADVARIYSAYDNLKSERGLLDIEDVLLVTVGALISNPGILDEVQTAYRWFTVDEYQDLNPLQHRLLTLWRGERDEVCAVGDVSQTIYSFAGASADYLTNFRSEFPDATEVRLVNCYRCTPEIVGVANTVIQGAKTKGALVLRSMCEPGLVPLIESYSDEIAEATGVASAISSHLAAGVLARDIAVLFRMNAQSANLEAAMAAAGVDVVMRGAERFFDRPEVREGVTRIRGAARSGESARPLGEEVRGILGAAGWTPSRPEGSGAVRQRWESLAALVTLADENPQWNLAAFITELDHRSKAQHAPAADAVTLAPLHSAKGLEWRVVFIIGCSEGLLPLANAGPDAEEERRLFYVGITRARTLLHLSWSRARQPGGQESRDVSRFLTELANNAGVADLGSAAKQVAGSVRLGSGRIRTERKQRAPGKCRVCGRGLVSPHERTLGHCRSCPVDFDVSVVQALQKWRSEQAQRTQTPEFMIMTDVGLQAIAEQMPSGLAELMDIPGMRASKAESFGTSLLALLALLRDLT